MLRKKHKWKIIISVLIVAVLAAAFCLGSPPGTAGLPAPAPSVPTADAEPTAPPTHAQPPLETPAPEPTAQTLPETGEDKFSADPAPQEEPPPVEPQDVALDPSAYTCTISISCAAILDNIDLCAPETRELVPEDGWILQPVAVTFREGESVFDVLERVCVQNGIHMEFENTPINNSAYIEGIHNLYALDAGELSGWMYKVNEWFPNYGCSRYQLQNGDVICWVYTCDLGCDVGGGYAAGD